MHNKAVSSAAAWLEADLSVAAWIDENFSCCLCSDPGDDRPIRYFTLCPRHQERTRNDTDNLIWCTNRHSLLFPAKFLCDMCKKPFCKNCTMVMQGKTHCKEKKSSASWAESSWTATCIHAPMVPARACVTYNVQSCSRTLSVGDGDTDLCQRRLKMWCLNHPTAIDRNDHMSQKKFPLYI